MKLDLNAVQILNKEGLWTHDLPGNNFLFYLQFNISKIIDFTLEIRIPNIRNYKNIWIKDFLILCYSRYVEMCFFNVFVQKKTKKSKKIATKFSKKWVLKFARKYWLMVSVAFLHKIEKAQFDWCLESTAPKRWSKYTTKVYKLLLFIVIRVITWIPELIPRFWNGCFHRYWKYVISGIFNA